LGEVPGIEGVLKAACGQHHTVVLTSSGKIFTWGHNKYGQLGLDPTLHPVVPSPHALDISLNIVNIFAGWTFTVILSGMQFSSLLCYFNIQLHIFILIFF